MTVIYEPLAHCDPVPFFYAEDEREEKAMERLYLDEFPGTKYRTCLVKEESDGDGTGAPTALHNSENAYRYIRSGLENKDREVLVVILLDIKNVPIGVNLVSIGSLGRSIAQPREVYKAAILASAKSIVLAHNHPSGDPAPSEEDIKTTQQLKQAGDILGVSVLDHIIVGRDCYCSIADQGYLKSGGV